MKKLLQIIGCFLIVSAVYAQNINQYKYVVVPKKFEALKDTNQYQLNSLTKLLFEDSGFAAIYEDQLPEALQKNNCLGIRASLINTSGMFTTKLKIVLKDCRNNVVFTSIEGKSREKEFKTGYRDALRKAFTSIKALQYQYQSEQPEETVQQIIKPEETETAVMVTKTSQQTPQTTVSEMRLYAQPLAHGFQLVDSSPRVVYILKKTSLADVYILKDKDGIIYKDADRWIIEYYHNDILVKEQLTIKF